jgi:hypothetical protein
VTLQNRVTPLGELIADPARGLVYGNRGCLHDAGGRIRRDFAVRRWIACRLEFRGWQRGPKMRPGRFTELFFLDDATALAAGHRPCALCRREDYNRLLEVWGRLHPGDHGADEIDLRLHDQRLDGRERRLHAATYDELPDGAYVMVEGAPWLVWGDGLLRWSASGYHRRAPRPRRARAQLLTPPSLVELLRDGRQGLVPLAHPSHRSARCGTLSG